MMNDAKYVWASATPGVRPALDWVVFRRDLEVDGAVSRAEIHLFTTTLYRLRVNGKIVGCGPVRYTTGNEEYDTYDLVKELKSGRNCITVEACFIDFNNFQHMAEPAGRFLVSGEVVDASGTSATLGTPGDWRAVRPTAWSSQVPCFSFAIGPIEALDQAAMPEGWCDPESDVAARWGGTEPSAHPETALPTPRDVPYPTDDIITPTTMFAAPLVDDEQTFGFLSQHPTSRASHHESTRDDYCRYAAFIHSPESQSVTLGVHWGPHFLNGSELKPVDDAERGNRQNATVTLNAGWNLLCGEVQQLMPLYPVLLAIPKSAGLEVHSTPDHNDPSPLRWQLARRIGKEESWAKRAPHSAEELDLNDATWHVVEVGPGKGPQLPSREMSWDVPCEDQRVNAPAMPLKRSQRDGPFTTLFDFPSEYLGHLVIEVDAPAGTLIDVGYDERLRPDGCLNWFVSNPIIDTADRFICAGGPETFETFFTRGGKFLQITMRPNDDAAEDAPVVLNKVYLRDGRCLPVFDKTYTFNNELHDWTWEVGIETLRASSEDLHCDSPWRERGAYLGDSYVQSLVEILATSDHRMARRCLRVFAGGQCENGMIPSVVPSWHTLDAHEDFVLIFAIWLHDHWKLADDIDIVHECLPAVHRLLASPSWQTSSHSSLWDAPEDSTMVFIDWGALLEMRTCDENGVLNAFRFHALRCAAAMCEAVGQSSEAREYQEHADVLGQAYRDRLWLEKEGRFAGGTVEGQPIEKEALHGNILALAYGMADAEQEPALIEYVVGRMKGNAAHAKQGQQHDDFAELYFLKFVLDAMVRIDRHDVALQVIDDHMQVMKDANVWTFWECISRGVKERGSLCHSWSAAPLEYLAKYADQKSGSAV